jgi:uncharacterized membrane protein YhaH (DUF805 family)
MFKELFLSEGRIRRTEYGLSVIIGLVFVIIVFLIQDVILLHAGPPWVNETDTSYLSLKTLSPLCTVLLGYIPCVMASWFLITQNTKRCHDIGKSGWWQLIPFFSVWLLLKKGDEGDNSYGADPKKKKATIQATPISPYTIICKNCNTRVARTPNLICIKCTMPKWGYTDYELAALWQPAPTSQYTLVCNNCKTVVARTPNNICVKCGKYNWGYPDNPLGVTSGLPKPPVPLIKKITIPALIVLFLIFSSVFIYKKYFSSLTKQEVFDKYGNNVVLVYYQYIYQVQFYGDRPDSLDFIKLSNGGFWLYNGDSIMSNEVYATGLILDNNKILINSAVLNPWTDEDLENLKNQISANLGGEDNIRVKGKSIYLGVGLKDKLIKDTKGMVACKYLNSMNDMAIIAPLTGTIVASNNDAEFAVISIPDIDAKQLNTYSLSISNSKPFIDDHEEKIIVQGDDYTGTGANSIKIDSSGNLGYLGAPVFDNKGKLMGILDKKGILQQAAPADFNNLLNTKN